MLSGTISQSMSVLQAISIGTELSTLKPHVAQYQRKRCHPRTLEDELNDMSVRECRIYMPSILRWMETAAEKTGSPFHRLDAHISVLIAITRAESHPAATHEQERGSEPHQD